MSQTNRIKFNRRQLSALGCALIAVLCVARAARATLYWDTNGATAGSSAGTTAPGNWDTTTADWSTNANGTAATQAWTAGETAVFAAGTNATGTYTVQITHDVTVAGITVQEGFPTISGSTSAGISLSNNALAIDTGSNSLRISAPYFFNGAITKTGSGMLYSDADQRNYSGKWVINGGTVSFPFGAAIAANSAALVPDKVTLNNGSTLAFSATTPTYDNHGLTLGPGGGQLSIANGATLVWNGPITGSSGGALTIGGSGGTVVLSGSGNNYDGATNLTGSSLQLDSSNQIPDTSVVNITADGIHFDMYSYSDTIKSLAGNFGEVLINTSTLTLANPAGEINGNQMRASVGGKIVKNGTGAITFTGANNNFLGEFILNSGTIGIGNNAALGSASGAKITINGGKLANDGAAVRSIPAAVPVALNGDFGIDASLNGAPGQIVINGAATMNSNRTVTVDGNASLALLDLRESTAGLALTKLGTGTLELGGGVSTGRFSGALNILAGRLQIGLTATIGTGSNPLTLSGATFNLTASRQGSIITNPLNVPVDSLITATSTEATVELNLSSNSIGGAGKITFRNDAPSGTNLFRPQFSGSGVSFAPGPIEIANGAFGTTIFQSTNLPNTTQTYANVISGNGAFMRTVNAGGAGGTTVLTAANTYSGGTNVSIGTLLVNNTSGSGTGAGAVSVGSLGTLGGTGTISGAVTNSGKISPGASIGTLTINNNVTMSANSHLAIEISPSGADRLVVGGNLDLSAVDFLDVTGRGSGNSWVIATYGGTLSGVFNNIPPGYNVNYGSGIHSQITLYFGSGDFNGDTLVDAGDYVSWRKNQGTSHALANDAGLGTPVGAAHYNLWRSTFGHSTLMGTGGGLDGDAAIPEPCSAALFGMGMLAAGLRRGRRSRASGHLRRR